MKIVSHLAPQGGHWRLPDPDREQIEQRLPGVQIAGAGLDVTTPEPLHNVVDKRLGYVAG